MTLNKKEKNKKKVSLHVQNACNEVSCTYFLEDKFQLFYFVKKNSKFQLK